MGLGTKLKTALNGDKTRDGPRKSKTFESTNSNSTKAPTPPAKTTPGAFPNTPGGETPRTLTTNPTDVNTAWNEPKPTHPQQHAAIREPSPDYTFRTAESEAGFTDDVSQVSDFDDRTSIGETVDTPLAGPKHNRLSKEQKYPYWGAAGTGPHTNVNGPAGANYESTHATAAPGTAMTGTTTSSPRSAATATMTGHNATHADTHVKFSTAPQRQVGDVYNRSEAIESTYGELGNAGLDTPPAARTALEPRSAGAAPPIPDKVPGRMAHNENNAYYNTNNHTNGLEGTSTGTGLGMTNGATGTHGMTTGMHNLSLDRNEPILDREAKIHEYGAPTNAADHRREASTSARGLAAAAMARRHRDEDMREYEAPAVSGPVYNGVQGHGVQGHGQGYSPVQSHPHALNTNTGAYTHEDDRFNGVSRAGTGMSHHDRVSSPMDSHAGINRVGTGMSHHDRVNSPYQKHSPKDSGFEEYSPASTKMMPGGGMMPSAAEMGPGHHGPGHQPWKVMHRCTGCGMDNDISRYFKKEVVYRIGD